MLWPGDIIQYRDVRFEGANYWSTAAHHTADVAANRGTASARAFTQRVQLDSWCLTGSS